MATTQVPAIDMNKLNAFIGQFVTDLGAAVHSGMVVIGEKLGLYKALAGGSMSSAELAARTQTDERYLREWLSSQAAGGYITYDEHTNKFSLSEEQAFALANEDSPAYLPGAFELALGSLAAVPGSPNPFAVALEWDGANMSTAFSMVVRNSFVQAMPRTWSALGFPHSKASKKNSRQEHEWRTLVAGKGPRLC